MSHAINARNSYQVYQGELPPLDVPTGLSATALPGGGIELQWQAVDEAVEYQLYRQAPGESELTAYRRSTTTDFSDSGLLDGDYLYTIASVRLANARESISGQSDAGTVSSDSLAAQPPENLSLEPVGAGIKALWDAPTGNSEALSYNLYRASGKTLTDVSGLTPIQTHIIGDNSAELTGAIVLKVMSDESGSEPLAIINLEYQLSEAKPAPYFTPHFLETGVAHDATINETITLENRGLAEMTDVHVSLLTENGATPPDWIYLMSPQSQGNLAIGATRQIQFSANPSTLVADGIYPFKLRVESGNHPQQWIEA